MAGGLRDKMSRIVILFWYIAFRIETAEAVWDNHEENHRRYLLVVEQVFLQKELFKKIPVQVFLYCFTILLFCPELTRFPAR